MANDAMAMLTALQEQMVAIQRKNEEEINDLRCINEEEIDALRHENEEIKEMLYNY